MLQPITDEEQDWLDGLRLGRETALRQIFQHYFKYLLVTAANVTGDSNKAKDLVQDVFLELWKKREQIVVQSSLKSYLRRAVVNRSLNFIKSQKRFDYGDDPVDPFRADPSMDAQSKLELADLQAVIQQTVDNLPDKCRAVFLLSRYENLSHKEIAAKLGISTKTIENQITKALRALRTAVREMKEAGE